MAKNKTGGNTQAIEEKPKKPKNIAQVSLIVRDDGSLIGDFWIWEDDEFDRHKKWTVGGEDFFKFLNRVQPKNIRVLASCLNVQIVMAGLPEDQQGPWVTTKGGKTRILSGEEVVECMKRLGSSPMPGQAERLVESSERAAEKAAGLPPQIPSTGPQAVG